MNHLRLNLILDREMLPKVISYYIYRSQEQDKGRPIVDGVYIQRESMGRRPPENMTLSLEWIEGQS
jgi:hypothetical protein